MTLDDLHYNSETGKFTQISNPWRTVGHVNSRGYLVIKINGKTYQAGRLAWYLANGQWPANEIDHIDQNKVNNKLANLRDVTRSENQINIPPRTGTREKGIYYRLETGKFVVLVRRDYQLTYIGSYNTLGEAITARDTRLEESVR